MMDRQKSRFKILQSTVLIISLAGIAYLAYSVATGKIILVKQLAMKQQYISFETKNPALDFTFEYPEDWKPYETQGQSEKYDSVQVMGPKDEKNEFNISMSITVKPLGNDRSNPSELLSGYLKRSNNLSNFKVLETKKVQLGGQETSFAIYQYTDRLPIWKKNTREVLMKKGTGFIRKDDKFYRFTFSGTAEQFRQYEPVLERMIKTFRIN